MKSTKPSLLARCLGEFFTEYLSAVRGMSPHTQSSYRDSLVLLLRFLCSRFRLHPTALDLEHVTADAVLAFLDYLEEERHNGVSTRNVRLAAIHAFFSYVGSRYPERSHEVQPILAIPVKRSSLQKPIDYLEDEELAALFASIDRTDTKGRRDHALLAFMFNTGARVQEVLDVRPCDLQLGRPSQVRLRGKGRKERICPLWPQTAGLLKKLLAERGLEPRSQEKLFVNRRGEPLSRFGVRYILATYIEAAQRSCPSLEKKRIHPHSVRHSTAISLLSAGVDLYSISQWLGHASMNTTGRYATLDLQMKRRVLSLAKPKGSLSYSQTKWRRDSNILEWLESL